MGRWLVAVACLYVAFYALWNGAVASDPVAAASLGLISAGTWLISALLPFYEDDIRNNNPIVLYGLNAIAATATGASVLLSLDGGWQRAFVHPQVVPVRLAYDIPKAEQPHNDDRILAMRAAERLYAANKMLRACEDRRPGERDRYLWFKGCQRDVMEYLIPLHPSQSPNP